jgi:cystathionine beta-synthase
MTREVARKEGIFAGNSTGSAVAGLLQMKDRFKAGDVVVIIFPDHGTRYLGKMYNDDWLRDRGFLKDGKLTARDIISKKESQEIVTIDCEKTVLEAINTIKSLNISQIPVTQKGMVIGKITESDILDSLIENPGIKSQPVKNISTAPFPFVDLNTSIDKISGMINKDNIAVLVEDDNGKIEIITQYDIINAISA